MAVNGSKLLQAAPILGMKVSKHHEHGVSWGLSEVGYDIRIKQQIIFSGRTTFSMNGHLLLTAPSVQIRDDQKVEIQEGNLVLASAIEEFNMPPDLVGIVHDKSTWARHGLSVFNTVIEPGWKGYLTLELVYHGQPGLLIPAGAGIAQVIFHRITCPAEYKGKYQNQGDYPVAPVMIS